MKKLVSLAVLTTVLTGCMQNNGTPAAAYGTDGFGEETLVTDANAQSLNDAYLMAAAPKYFIGNAYKVEDVQYIPVEDLTYNQTGVAGIIPAELNGTKTSNGEVFDAAQMVATSKTLPLPTIARVTNLDNGQSVVVRVNNRGPFVNTRIMDLSPAAAEKIGINGTSKVQVQVMAEESTAVKNATVGIPVQTTVTEETITTTPVATSGEYSVQIAAFSTQDSADAMASRMSAYGATTVVNEGDLYKVRIINLDAARARSTIDALRSNEGMVPGLLKDGRWVNADSI